MNPTRPFRLGPWVAETGLGAANWVLEVVLAVDAGGGIENWLEEADCGAGAGAGAGVADWKSSNSSSSAGLDPRMSKLALPAGCLPAAVEVVVGGSSSPSRSTSGSFGGAGFVSRREVARGGLGRRRGGDASPSSYSSYSSNRLLLRPKSWKSFDPPPKPPPSPKTPPLYPPNDMLSLPNPPYLPPVLDKPLPIFIPPSNPLNLFRLALAFFLSVRIISTSPSNFTSSEDLLRTLIP